MKIIIAGAGIGGLTAALALLKKGFDVTILEQAQALKEIGAGVQLSPNATRVLYQLGLGGTLEHDACEPLGKRVRLPQRSTATISFLNPRSVLLTLRSSCSI